MVAAQGRDEDKDQSYVLHMLSQSQLARMRLPIGDLTKAEVRGIATRLGLRTAAKPDSQDVCFISRSGGRQAFLGSRIGLRAGQVVDESGAVVGAVPAVELVTVGQRKGLGLEPAGPDGGGPRYVVDVDVAGATVTVAPLEALLVTRIAVRDLAWVDGPPGPDERLEVQVSAHGRPVAATWSPSGSVLTGEPIRRVAPGQSVVLYRGDAVVGGGTAVAGRPEGSSGHTPSVSSAS